MKIAIASGKGGTGKTTVSTNLAAFLSETADVVLTDLDVEEPNSGLFLEKRLIREDVVYRKVPLWHKDKCTLCGQCQDVCNFNAVIKMKDYIMILPQLCHGCFACSELCPSDALEMIGTETGMVRIYKTGSFRFIEGKLDVGQEQAVPLIEKTMSYSEKESSEGWICLYDSPPGTSCPVIEAVKDADLVLLVTEPTPFGLNDLKLAVETMRALDRDFAVVINRDGLGDSSVLDYCTTEHIPVAARIPNDRRAAEEYSRGHLLYKDFPAIRTAMSELAAFIAKKGGPAV